MNVGAIDLGEDLHGLAEIKRAQPAVVESMLHDDVAPAEVLAKITALNIQLHQRIFERVLATTSANGIARPPVPVTLLVMGSAARGESFLNPDQDNGFILGDYDDADHERLDPYFIALAERLNNDLAEIGFPLCSGHIMARNPVWRKTESQWRAQLARWTQRRDPVAVRFADALLDFRAIAGPIEPAERLRAQLAHAFQTNDALLTELCRGGPEHSVALGWFGHLVTRHNGKDRGMIDLKEHGLLPLVSSVRLWALKHAVPPRDTVGRLRALEELGQLDSDASTALIGAFDALARLILAQQLKVARAGQEIGYLIDPVQLTRDDRDRLVDSLRRVASFQAETRAIFASELY